MTPPDRPQDAASPATPRDGAVDSRRGAGSQPDASVRRDANDSARPADVSRDSAKTRQGGEASGGRDSSIERDIPDDYGHETSNPDDLEPPDEHAQR